MAVEPLPALRLAIQKHLPTVLAGCFAMGWVIARANIQAVTVDEADSYLGFMQPDWPAHWYPSSGNHVLNSILIRLTTWLFGLSHLTLRGPALLGAALYILAVYRICTLIASQEILIWPVFICLVYNPFVMDYMLAARGYSLALGFLMTAVFLLAREMVAGRTGDQRPLQRVCAWASLLTGLSFTANFSFAYVDLLCMAVFLAWANWKRPWRERAAIAFAGSWPGLLAIFLIAGSVLWTWPKGELTYGARSLSEMRRSILSSSFYEINQAIVHPVLQTAMEQVAIYLPRIALTLALCELVLVAMARRTQPDSPRGRLFRVALYLFGMIAGAILLHWVQFKLFGLPLPKERTALYFVPLSVLLFAILTALVPRTLLGRTLRTASLGTLFVCATYFLGCLRLLYFHEWRFGSEVRTAFGVIDDLARRNGIRELSSSWEYVSAIRFYLVYFHEAGIQCDGFDQAPPQGKAIYVLTYGKSARFIQEQGLKIFYRGDITELVVAAQPSLAAR